MDTVDVRQGGEKRLRAHLLSVGPENNSTSSYTARVTTCPVFHWNAHFSNYLNQQGLEILHSLPLKINFMGWGYWLVLATSD